MFKHTEVFAYCLRYCNMHVRSFQKVLCRIPWWDWWFSTSFKKRLSCSEIFPKSLVAADYLNIIREILKPYDITSSLRVLIREGLILNPNIWRRLSLFPCIGYTQAICCLHSLHGPFQHCSRINCVISIAYLDTLLCSMVQSITIWSYRWPCLSITLLPYG